MTLSDAERRKRHLAAKKRYMLGPSVYESDAYAEGSLLNLKTVFTIYMGSKAL